ncbi:auxin-responsive protein IAA26-like isoform X2 [Diospyros lotus]|uniref:auxin-responsive protein IAA26-like isoform X2 n=1 Tax=Diospyros lotus TaxID=55363 RepID=UPI0022523FE4|nr:auxin-responsive protein IAA26-like isoform X2 [Diospyros lotus]
MEGGPNKLLLDLIDKDREWAIHRDGERSHGSSEEKSLELRLAPPGEDWTTRKGYFSNNTIQNLNTSSGAKRGFAENGWVMNKNGSHSQNHKFSFSETTGWSSLNQANGAPFLHLQSNPQNLPVMAKESSQPCGSKALDLPAEKKAFSPASANPAVPSSSQKRTAPAPVVGWPPIRSFRRNLASSSSSKPINEPQNAVPSKPPTEKPAESFQKGLFVKINMDGVPIGRKVDLKAFDSYEKLSSAVDELFRGLLAAQKDSSAGGIPNGQEGEKGITGLLDGSGEYTLVYEDNEGDRMLVGDVPWHMFVSTVKRLRVLKSSELSSLRCGSKQEKITVDAGVAP